MAKGIRTHRHKGTISPNAANISYEVLASMNVEQATKENRARLDELGGLEAVAKNIGVNLDRGLNQVQVEALRNQFGSNVFPESPKQSFLSLLFDSFSDPTLLILLAAAAVSLGIGIVGDPDKGWIEGTAIFIAVFLVANISAVNNYTKELQFRALEQSSQEDERASVMREGYILRVNPRELVIGDIVVIQAGDIVPADCIIISNCTLFSNQSSLTGESHEIKKTKNADCFLLSSCLVTDGEDCRALVIGIGASSQWGKIKANLVTEAVNTPLQDKLEIMSKQIGYVGMVCAVGTFVALVINIWARNDGQDITSGFIDAFILAVTIVVVAIPEGLPLAVTIALAYSTKKMYKDQCFIRVLAACETMGNCTNICSDKTGTLTQNKMTVVEGWFGDVALDQSTFHQSFIPPRVKRLLLEHVCVNRTAYLVFKDPVYHDKSSIIGNKTEGVLIEMVQDWGFNYEEVKQSLFNEEVDRVFVFNSYKKRSTAIVHRHDGSVRLYCKGAPEWVLPDCSHYSNAEGDELPMSAFKKNELEITVLNMANNALRTLLIAHKDFKSRADLPDDWKDNPPDNGRLCIDSIVGIMDPLRPDVKESIDIAHQAGVYVRMVTGDSVATACAIARQCGILTDDGMTMIGPDFRKMTPAAVDEILPKLQVLARSSPDDKYLLVTRLNGFGLPSTQEEWEAKHCPTGSSKIAYETHKDKLLPGYREEWAATRPHGGEVVGVTGDGTNDAPALKAADVGLAMGITGTKVAQGASDIVILDDRFSSIIRAIIWGRSIYDNIRKFLQFQLTVNIVALVLVFIGAVSGFGQPLNAVQLLWVNLVMDTLGALALGTEAPTNHLIKRKPYKRSASLISRPMWRNMLCMALFQLTVLFVLMFDGPALLGIEEGTVCSRYRVHSKSTAQWNVLTLQRYDNRSDTSLYSCAKFGEICPGSKNRACFVEMHSFVDPKTSLSRYYSFEGLPGFESSCLECMDYDYTHGTIIFNTFIFLQIFNEYAARVLTDDLNMFSGILDNKMFLIVSAITCGMQIFLVEVGGPFVKTSSLSLEQWLITIFIGFLTLPISMMIRFIPVKEDPNSFYNSNFGSSDAGPSSGASVDNLEKFVQQTSDRSLNSNSKLVSVKAKQQSFRGGISSKSGKSAGSHSHKSSKLKSSKVKRGDSKSKLLER